MPSQPNPKVGPKPLASARGPACAPAAPAPFRARSAPRSAKRPAERCPLHRRVRSRPERAAADPAAKRVVAEPPAGAPDPRLRHRDAHAPPLPPPPFRSELDEIARQHAGSSSRCRPRQGAVVSVSRCQRPAGLECLPEGLDGCSLPAPKACRILMLPDRSAARVWRPDP